MTQHRLKRLNRTIMELKFAEDRGDLSEQGVLIVPLWN